MSGRNALLALMSVILWAGVVSAQAPQPATQRFITIGTGGVTGVYFAAGGAICRLVNRERRQHGIRCSVESTGGSGSNITALRQGDLDFGIIQSDTQFNALKGVGAFQAAGPFVDLRSVFALHSEVFTVVISKTLAAAGIEDLKGKRFNLGNQGSGTRNSADELLEALGWKSSVFALVGELRADDHGPALCSDKIDGFLYVVGHPAANIKDVTVECGAKLLPVTGPAIDTLLATKPYFARATIPGGLYPGNPAPTLSFGSPATLVTGANVPEDLVYLLVRTVFENFTDFTQLHPALAQLKPETMIKEGLTAPLHDGARRYYVEKGWLK